MHKKSFFYNHPIITGIITLIVTFLATNLIAAIPIKLFGSNLGDDAKMNLFNITVICVSILALALMRFLNRKNGYRGGLKVYGRNLRDVWICIVIYTVVVFGSIFASIAALPNGFASIPAPTITSIIMAIYAGINEEILDRGMPLGLMMRNQPDSKRIRAAVILTSLFFGVTHMINAIGAADIVPTIVQCIFAILMGLFFAAIYLRTGSILITIVIHMIYDIIALVLATAVGEEESGILNILSMARTLLPFVLSLFMLRKKYHAEIVETWHRIWPEKDSAESN